MRSLRTFSPVFTTCALFATAVSAQQPPTRPIMLVVPYAAGGGTDLIARLIADRVGRVLGRGVYIENRAGASTNIGASFVTRAPGDGSVLLMGDLALATNPSLFKSLPYSPTKDLTPVALVATSSLALVTSSKAEFDTVQELAAAAKSGAKPIFFAIAGTGNPTHLAAEMFKASTTGNLTAVPYKGTGPALLDIVGGRVDLMFTGVGSTKALIDDKQLRALAVTGPRRSAALPNVPTMQESGYPNFLISSWWGVFGPSSLRPEIGSAVSAAIKEAMSDPELQSKLDDLNIEADYRSGSELRAYLEAETNRWSEVIKSAGIQAE